MSQAGSRIDALLPGLVAWWTGIAAPVWSGPSPLASQTSSVLAAPALIAGTLLIHRWPRLGRGLGVGGFVACSVFAWVAAPSGLLTHRLDPFVLAIAVVAWTVFAMGWGTLELAAATADTQAAATRTDAQLVEKEGARPRPILPRLDLGWKTTVAVAAAAIGALGLLLSALPVVERERGIFAQITAGAAALAVVAVLGNVVRPKGRVIRVADAGLRAVRRPRGLPFSVVLCLALAVVVLVVLLVRDG